MADLRQAFVDLLAASRKGADDLQHAFTVAVGEKTAATGKLASHSEFVKAIEKAEQALKEVDASA